MSFSQGNFVGAGVPGERCLPGAPVNGVDQVWTLSTTGTGGTQVLLVAFGGQTKSTGALAWNASAATVAAALNALPHHGTGAWTATGGPLNSSSIVITAAGPISGLPVTMTVDTTLVTGGAASLVNTTAGVSGSFRGAPVGTLLVDSADGVLYLQSGTATKPTWTKIGIVQQGALTALTDGSGGAANPATGIATISDTATKNAVATLTASLNAVITALHNAGVTL